jgi:hypothetical protein
LQVGFILNQSDIFFELVLNRFGFSADVSLYFFRSQFSFEIGSPATTVSIKAWLSSNVKRLWFVILPVRLIRHNKPLS